MTDTREITRRLATCYTGAVHDVLREMGVKNFTLPIRLRPLMPEKTLCGPAFTIEGHLDDTADAHQTLLEWTGLLSQAPEGHIWVCQPNNHEIALMGELSSETLQKRGILGCVIDGLIRDAEFMVKNGFQNWHSGFTPKDVVGRWLPVATRHTIHIGDVAIASGDYLLGDRDGIVRIPKDIVVEVTDRSVDAMQKENLVRTGIMAGMDPQEAYLKYGKF